jgi:hypothetical protein
MISFIVFSLYIWFDTEAFAEYSKIFKLKFTKYEEFYKFKELAPTISYSDFLITKYNSFLTRLLACPSCLTVWLVFFCFCLSGFSFNPFFTVISCWIGYYGLSWLVKKFNN